MATVIFNTDTKILTLTGTHTLGTVSNGHIHIGALGVSGGVAFPLDVFTSPMSLTTIALTAQEEADLNAGLYYVNLHSPTYGPGEIRGQLLKQ